MANTSNLQSHLHLRIFIRTILRGISQVMFQCSSWAGLFILTGIFLGAFASGTPTAAWGAITGLASSTLAGYLTDDNFTDGYNGLWGFNGILVGCALPSFLPDTWLLWCAIIFFAMLTTWVRRGLNNIMAPFGINSLTFPFVMLTWILLFSTRIFAAFNPEGLPLPALPTTAHEDFSLNCSFANLVVYWLKGISQVFLINSWMTGILFLIALFLCNRRAAVWAAIGSATALSLAVLMKADPTDIANGLFGFSPVLTGIALGTTFYQVKWRTALRTLAGIITTVFIQGAMDIILEIWGIPTLTAPFCVATWLFLLPRYKFACATSDHTQATPQKGADDFHDLR